MATLHDIDRRIKSVESTKQITRTMQMVAAAKIRMATERVDLMTPYSNAMAEMLSNIARVGGTDSPLLVEHDEVKNVVIIVMTSDRGLAGGFNSSVLRQADRIMKEKQAAGIKVHIVACGKKAISYYNYRNIEMIAQFRDLSADPTEEQAQAIGDNAIDFYVDGRLDEIILLYNHAKNAGEQVLTEELLLPIDIKSFIPEGEVFEAGAITAPDADDADLTGSIEYEPDEETVLAKLLPAYVVTTVYHALVDSAAAEQAARRNAMKNATDNATEMIETLTRLYNRVRQGAITTELNEIIGGASALED